MLSGGEEIVTTGYQYWSKNLPVLLVHGKEDKVSDPKSTEEFFGKLSASDKVLSLYEGGFHELHNEPDGVKERLIKECIGWVNEHLSKTGHTLSKL